jgi:polyphosphate:AMP phosphotransferase
MLEQIDLKKSLSKEMYETEKDELRRQLSELQRKAKDLNIPVLIIFEGWDAAGKGTQLNRLLQPLDARHFTVHNIKPATEEEKRYPYLWRFWTKTPAKGEIALFNESYYQRVLIDPLEDPDIDKRATYETIRKFEQQLNDDGTLIVKLFFHIDKKEQKKRFRKLEDNPATSWRITKKDWKDHKSYKQLRELANETIEQTSTKYAPWYIIESNDKRYATSKMFKIIISAIQDAIAETRKRNERKERAKIIIKDPEITQSVLDQVSLDDKTLSEEGYLEQRNKYQKKLNDLCYELYDRQVPVIVAYEGWDAAGKGGNIQRLKKSLDPRGYDVHPIAAPTKEELAHHFLWRFWKKIPRNGHIAIFDRTWYGRVLVEPIEGFCTKEEFRRAYDEINQFEYQLSQQGAVIFKFWLQISNEEQLARFNARQENPEKQWKITEEDWRNREKWDKYKYAVDQMLFKTSTTYAPWDVIESNDKKYARVKVLKTVVERLEDQLEEVR